MAQSYTAPAQDHTKAEKAPPAPEPGHVLLRDMIAAMEGLAQHVPGAHAMSARFAAMHAKLDDMIDPPKK